LSAGLVPGVADERRAALATQALKIARRLDDPTTLAHVLEMKHWTVRAPDNLDEQLSLASELADVALKTGDRRQELEARVWVLDHYLELGDADAVERELATLQRLGDDLKDRRSRWILVNTHARHAHLAGRLVDFEALAQEALANSVEGQDKSGTQIFGGQMVALRREQQRLDEVVGALEGFVTQFPGVAVWQSTLAYAYAELDRRIEAHAQLELLARNSFTDLPRDGFWMSSMAMLSEVVAFLGDADRAQDLYERLMPFADRCVVISGVLCQGAASRSLGLLATTMARYDEAETHLAAAVELNSRLGAVLWVVHAQYNQATLWLHRAHALDRERALSLLDEVLITAAHLGLAALASRARDLKAQTLNRSAQAHRGAGPATPTPVAPSGVTESDQ
jgi:eukaryotic-like serine/threonine-protein kinase